MRHDVGIIFLEPRGGVRFASARARELFGCAEPDDPSRSRKEIEAHLQQLDWTENGTAELPLPGCTGGKRVRLEWDRRDGQTPLGRLVLVRDCDSAAALERELGLAVQMRCLDGASRSYVHDLRTPLNTVVMTVELLAKAAAHVEDESARDRLDRHLAVIRNQCRTIDDRLKSLLGQATARDEGPCPLDLGELVAEAAEPLAVIARQRNVGLRLEPCSTPVPITGRPGRLKQAIQSIALLALDRVPGEGSVTLAVTSAPDGVRISFRFDGADGPRELLEALSRTGSLGSPADTPLRVARSVVGAHRGRFAVAGTSDGGSALELFLPAGEGE